MSNQRYSPEFKDEAVRQIVDRGYSVTDVSERLGVSAHSLYKWVKAIKPDKSEEQAAALIEAKSEVLKQPVGDPQNRPFEWLLLSKADPSPTKSCRVFLHKANPTSLAHA